jgi:hypothetical protein
MTRRRMTTFIITTTTTNEYDDVYYFSPLQKWTRNTRKESLGSKRKIDGRAENIIKKNTTWQNVASSTAGRWWWS